MVSNARLDLPDPERPVMTVRLSRGMSTSIPLRLCSRAPRTEIWVSIGAFVPALFYEYRLGSPMANAACAIWVLLPRLPMLVDRILTLVDVRWSGWCAQAKRHSSHCIGGEFP